MEKDELAEVIVVETPIMQGVNLLPAKAHPENFCYRCDTLLDTPEEFLQGIHEACFMLELSENEV